MKTLSEVLIDYKGKKLEGDLFDLKYVGHGNDLYGVMEDALVVGGKPTGYCALGVLACEKKQVTTKKIAKYWTDHYRAIIKAYVKNPKKLNKQFVIPVIAKDGSMEIISGHLWEIIPTMNDDTTMTIPQIGEVVEKLGY